MKFSVGNSLALPNRFWAVEASATRRYYIKSRVCTATGLCFRFRRRLFGMDCLSRCRLTAGVCWWA